MLTIISYNMMYYTYTIVCHTTLQCGLVGGEYYDSKETRLGQLLERLPLDGGAAVVFVSSPASASAARAVIAASQQANASVIAVAGRAAGSCLFPSGCQFVINYDLPSTGTIYIYIYICICMYVCMCIYIYIYTHEERERERDRYNI